MKKDLKIGEKAYPADNSFSICLSTRESAEFKTNTRNCGLSGDWETDAVEVTIKSQPFDIVTKNRGLSNKEYSFVIVEHDGLQYMVLNMFHDSLEDMLITKALINSMSDNDYPETL